MEPLAEHVRSHGNISGFTIGTIEHKINQFADDVIMMITNPALLPGFDSIAVEKVYRFILL